MTHLFTSPRMAVSSRFGLPGRLAQGLLLTGRWTVILLATAGAAHAASLAPVPAENGMVVTAQHLATRVGVDVLKDGGNAVDAAVAVGYALAVVYPAAGNLGGGGFMTIQLADGRKTFLDFREKAPLAARADMYLGPDGNVVPGLSTRGHLAVAVPGSVSGLEAALAQYGTMKRAALMAPAIRLAEQGFSARAGRCRHAALRQRRPAQGHGQRRGLPEQRGRLRCRARPWCRPTWRAHCAASATRARAASTRGRWARRSWRQQPGRPGLITQADLDQYRTRELSPWSATTAACVCQRRHPVRAGRSCARS
jgi:gamma-glutamyltranspeptidase/glutathione hydrolase